MKDRNVLKCPACGFAVYTEAREKHCARCETKMIFVCTEFEYRKKERKK